MTDTELEQPVDNPDVGVTSEPAPDPDEGLVTIKANDGKEYKVPAAFMDNLTRMMKAKETHEKIEKKTDDFDPLEIFVDPEKVLTKHAQRIEEKLRAEYAQAEQQREFWRGVVEHAPEMKGQERLLKMVLQEGWDEFAEMSPAKCRDALISRTRKVIRDISKLVPKGNEPEGKEKDQSTTLEGSGAKIPQGAKIELDDDGPKTLSDVIRARQAKMMKPLKH